MTKCVYRVDWTTWFCLEMSSFRRKMRKIHNFRNVLAISILCTVQVKRMSQRKRATLCIVMEMFYLSAIVKLGRKAQSQTDTAPVNDDVMNIHVMPCRRRLWSVSTLGERESSIDRLRTCRPGGVTGCPATNQPTTSSAIITSSSTISRLTHTYTYHPLLVS